MTTSNPFFKSQGTNRLRSANQITTAIAAGADPNVGNGCVLMYAVGEGAADQVKAALDGGAYFYRHATFNNSEDFDMQSWLIRQSVQSADGAVKLTHLKDAGLDLTHVNTDGECGLDYLTYGHGTSSNYRPFSKSDLSATANVLLDAGIQPTATSFNTMVKVGVDEETVKRAITMGADVNAIDSHTGNTPLFYAMTSPEMARCLIEHGANPNHRNHMGQTADELDTYATEARNVVRLARRDRLGAIAQASRPQDSDLASPEQALARRSSSRRM